LSAGDNWVALDTCGRVDEHGEQANFVPLWA
jgi:hypothetical protein